MDGIAKPALQNPIASTEETWSVAVFGRNEAASLGDCLHALARAGEGAALEITVMLNGSTDDSVVVATRTMRAAGLRGRICTIAYPDKSNAINQYLHGLRPPASVHFCVDAYAAVAPDALRLLAARLAAEPEANAAAAVPSSGRSAAALRASMLAYPGLHGSFFALRGCFVKRLAAARLRLPLDLYRGDGLLGSFVMHDLDAADVWTPSRVAVEPRATWTTRQLQPWRLADLQRAWRRLVRQGRGRLESRAIRNAIYSGGFGALPVEGNRLVLDWLGADPAARPQAWRDPFAALALRELHRPVPRPEALLPRVAAEVGA